MNPINTKLNQTIQSLVGRENLQNMVEKEWQTKARCLENLTNTNKDQLKKLELQLLKGLKYEGKEAITLFKELKESKNITPEQAKFANFLYLNYAKHSLKAQGFY